MDQVNVIKNSHGQTVVSVTLDNDTRTIEEAIKEARRALEIWIIRGGRD